jgi:predicted transglutaminase-like cysteine proteinase
MFARVAAYGFAAFVLIAPATSRDHGGALADAPAAAAMNATFAARWQPLLERENSAPNETQPRSKLAALDPAAPPSERAAPAEPFGLATMPWFAGDIITKWTGVQTEIRTEHDVLARCRDNADDCPPAAQKFLAIVAAGEAQSGRARIGAINRAVNLAIRPMSDLKQWGVADRWSPPLETFATGYGDCEDYAIAKFVALIEAGVAPEDVRLVVVRDLAVSDGHAVAAVRIDGSWIVLDNRWLALVDDEAMQRMVPLFVLDGSGVRAYLRTPPRQAAQAAAEGRLPSMD